MVKLEKKRVNCKLGCLDEIGELYRLHRHVTMLLQRWLRLLPLPRFPERQHSTAETVFPGRGSAAETTGGSRRDSRSPFVGATPFAYAEWGKLRVEANSWNNQTRPRLSRKRNPWKSASVPGSFSLLAWGYSSWGWPCL